MACLQFCLQCTAQEFTYLVCLQYCLQCTAEEFTYMVCLQYCLKCTMRYSYHQIYHISSISYSGCRIYQYNED